MDWKALFKPNILNGAQDYITSDAVKDYKDENGRITAKIEGIDTFNIEIVYADTVKGMKCSCPYALAGNNCKHMAAALLKWDDMNASVPVEDTSAVSVSEDTPEVTAVVDVPPVDDGGHLITEDFKGVKPSAFSICGKKSSASNWKDVLVGVCEFLYAKDSAKFEGFLTDPDMQGKSRKLFSTISSELVAPRIVPGTKIYIMTNYSADGIMQFISKLLGKYSIDINQVRIYLVEEKSEETSTISVPKSANTQKPSVNISASVAVSEAEEQKSGTEEEEIPPRVNIYLGFKPRNNVEFVVDGETEISIDDIANRRALVFGDLYLNNESGKVVSNVSLRFKFGSDLLDADDIGLNDIPVDEKGRAELPGAGFDLGAYADVARTRKCKLEVTLVIGEQEVATETTSVTIKPAPKEELEAILKVIAYEHELVKPGPVELFLSIDENKGVTFEGLHNPRIIYALFANKQELIIGSLHVNNESGADIKDVSLDVTFDTDLIAPMHVDLGEIPKDIDGYRDIEDPKVDPIKLAELTEIVNCNMTVSVSFGKDYSTSLEKPVELFPYDQWDGEFIHLPAYIMPNHPVVTKLLHDASDWLKANNLKPSLEGYQSDANRVKEQAAAFFAAIQKANVSYVSAPASFAVAQRIRLCDAVIEKHFGTCMDMTILYASCLEAARLNPVLIEAPGHIFVGLWMVPDKTLKKPEVYDSNYINTLVETGELMPIECTAMNSGKNMKFDDAVEASKYLVKQMATRAVNCCTVDVRAVRHMGLIPMPMRIKGEDGKYDIKVDELSLKELTSAPSAADEVFEYDDHVIKEDKGKISYWEHKLLDTSNRNKLVNFRMTETLPLFAQVSELEDSLADGNEFSIDAISDVSIPVDEIQALLVDQTLEMSPKDKGAINEALLSKRVFAPYEPKKLNTFLRKLYRTTADAMEETGTSTLYMVLGLLRWYDTTVLNAPVEIDDDESDNESKKGRKKKEPKVIELKPMYAPLILLPVDISRKSAGNYSLRLRDEAPRFNLTLLEMLNQKFGIVVNGVEPLPRDEHGLDTKRIFNSVRHATIEQENWGVVESAFLGNFTFGEFVMWNDMHSHEDELTKNKIVKSLVEGALTFDATVPENVDDDDVFLPMPADGSQLHAIKMAANDVSFVLHGPPGTGKSQTITALIANALTKGKTVLFVAEKQTALEVVAKRLKSLGIGAFCLELHSSKTNAREVLSQLEEPLNLELKGSAKSYEEKLVEANKLREELDAYGALIHKKLNSGYSLRELIDLYEDMGDVSPIIFDTSYTDTLDPKLIVAHKRIIEKLVAYGRGVGKHRIADFMPIRLSNYSQSMRTGLKPTVESYLSSLKKYLDVTAKLVDAIGITMPTSKVEWDTMLGMIQSTGKIEVCPEDVDTVEKVEYAYNAAKRYMQLNSQAKEKMMIALTVWKKEFLSLNMDTYIAELNDANSKFFKGKYIKTLQDKLTPFANSVVNMNAVLSQMELVKDYQRISQAAQSAYADITYSFKEQLNEEFTDAEIATVRDRLISACKAAEEAASKRLVSVEMLSNAEGVINELQAAKDELDMAYNEITDMLALNASSFMGDWIGGQISFAEKLLKNADYIKEWISYYQARCEGMGEGLAPVIRSYEDGDDDSTLIRAYEKGVYQTLIYSTIDIEPLLNAFNGATFADKISYFKKVDADLVQLAKDVMFYRLAQNLPSATDGLEISKEINLLRKAITGNQKLYIRSLFDQIPHILHRLCPCILMSPMSVSQYISIDSDQFDLVVFDEASQIPTHKAIGALARAKNAVIVGDPKQMPPTDFFGGGGDDTLTAEELKKTDLDSVLEDCLALGIPSAYLKWHYRSRHESLIQFSNANFYGNTMLTFPSVNDRESKVHMHFVVGDYNKGTNKVEAREIVKEIIRRSRDEQHKNESIGVVTFNVNQRDLIESLLQKEYEADSQFDVWAHGGVDGDREDIFVKNLENVQGDERDVILFSITYGPDEEGHVNQNFGPINKPGGDKRLNVAFSRARCEMMIFSSLKPENIVVKNHNPGTQAFHDFLKLAEMGSKPVGEQQEEFVYEDKGIINGVCKAITDAGYEVQKHIGHSDFQIDIGVVNPYNTSSYLLGIMLDGDTYAMTKDTKDREVSQVGVLGGLGWKIYRIWTMDWWDSREKQVNLLIEKLDTLKEQARIDHESKQEAEKSSEDVQLAEGGEEEYETYKEMSEQIEHDQSEKPMNTSEILEEISEGKLTDSVDNEAVTTVVEVNAEQEAINNNVVTSAEDTSSATSINTVVSGSTSETIVYVLEEKKTYDSVLPDMDASTFLDAANVKGLKQLVWDIVEIEAPISHDSLIKAIFKACNVSRGGKQVNEQVEKIIAAAKVKSTKYNGVKYYWSTNQDPNNYLTYRTGEVRNADDMCKQELRNVVAYILQENGPMDKDEIAREIMKLFGYTKLTAKVTEGAQLAIKVAKSMGAIELGDDKKYRRI